MNKKGANIILFIFEVLVVLLVIFIAINTARAYGKSETVAKINVAEEMRMMINTLVGIPGEALVQYPADLSSFMIVLRQDRVILFSREETEERWIERTFSLPADYAAEGVVEEQAKVCLEKKNKKILLKECPLLPLASAPEKIYPSLEDSGYEEDLEDDDFQLLSTGQTTAECFKENFGTYDDRTAELEFIKVGGKTFYVNKVMAEPLRQVTPLLDKMNYKVSKGNSCRSGTPSCGKFHSSCLAIDINPSENPHCPDWADKNDWLGRIPTTEEKERCWHSEIVTDLPLEIVEEFEKKGFYWGGRFQDPDPMHFEYIGDYNCCERTFGALPSFIPKSGLATGTEPSYTTEVTLNNYLDTLISTGNGQLTMKELILRIVNDRRFADNRYYVEIFKEHTKKYLEQNRKVGEVIVLNSAADYQYALYSFSNVIGSPTLRKSEVELPNPLDTQIPRVTVVMYVS